MNLKIAELRAIAEKLFVYLEETERCEFEIPEDHYWWIEKDAVYDPLKDPKELSIGQLSEDWDRLGSILNGGSPPIGYALVWLSSVLRIVGEENVY